MDAKTDREADEDETRKRKIQFTLPSPMSTPPAPQQIDTFRHRRPTPAVFFKLTEPSPPKEETDPHEVDSMEVLGGKETSEGKLVRKSTNQPPSSKQISFVNEEEEHEDESQQTASAKGGLNKTASPPDSMTRSADQSHDDESEDEAYEIKEDEVE